MPQIPKMPYPYMNTVDASDEIEFSCIIDSKDIITDYLINIEKIPSNNRLSFFAVVAVQKR